MQHENWTSRLAFLLAACGAAVGLGTLWRFPFVVGENGGGAFVLIYLGCVLLIGIPLMVVEFAMGRRGGGSPLGSLSKLIAEFGAHPGWRLIGWLSIGIPLIGMSYYAVVAGWTLPYAIRAVQGAFTGLDGPSAQRIFDELLANPASVFFWHTVFVGSVAAVVARGVRGGLELATRIMTPTLLALLLVLVAYAALASDFRAGVEFMMIPDFSAVTWQTVLMALGQTFFSIAVGSGALITYGSYLKQDVSLVQSAVIISLVVVVVAMLAGLAIFPIVFEHGLDPSAGPGLIFVTVPIAFGQIAVGNLLGIVFFCLLILAAFTTGIGMLEPVVSWLVERTGKPRPAMAALAGGIGWLLGLGPTLSFNLLADLRPLGFLDYFADMNLFSILDFFISNLLLPINGLLIALFGGWVMTSSVLQSEVRSTGGAIFLLWRLIMRVFAPVCIFAILLQNI